ncbi:hypothetical protein ACM66B_006112 [Microbotryomycetes sp. NB124-2]
MASAPAGHLDPTTNLSHVQWRAAEWLLAFGPLTVSSVMDYFVMSPFFDRTSNNATLRMQMQFSRGGMDGVDEENELRKFVGVEYAVVHAAPPSLFIIHKRDRVSPTEATPIAAYYVLNDSVYQGPSLHTVINERILTSLHALSRGLELLRAHKPKWTPENQNAWQVKPPPMSVVPTAAEDLSTLSNDAHPSINERKRQRDSDAGESSAAAHELATNAGDIDNDDEDVQRPANTFNPMLFRAMQSVASRLPASSDLATGALVPPPGDRAEIKQNVAATTNGDKAAPGSGGKTSVNGTDGGVVSPSKARRAE